VQTATGRSLATVTDDETSTNDLDHRADRHRPGSAAGCRVPPDASGVAEVDASATGSAADEVPDASFRLSVPEAPLPVLSPLLSLQGRSIRAL